MPDIALVAEVRAERGSPASRRARATGRVPAVIYGHGAEPLPISVDARELRTALAASGALFTVNVDGTQHLVIARDVQRHPVRHTVSHVDFQAVRRDEVIPAEVSIQLVGESHHITRLGGVVELALFALHVKAKPADIPESIDVDVSEIEIGGTIRIADIVLPTGVVTEADPETAVVIAAMPRGLEAAEGEGEAGEAAAGEASEDASSAEASEEAAEEASES